MSKKAKNVIPVDYNVHQNFMKIVNAKCWNCDKPMKVSIMFTGRTFYGPSEFTDQQIKFAQEKGVILKKQFSKTIHEEYLANTCGHCGSFVGDFFIHEYIDDGEDFEIDK